jgi:hypothetical protein
MNTVMDGIETGSLLYTETQRFRYSWILLLVGFVAILTWYAFLQQVIFRIPFGDNPGSDTLVVILLGAFGILLPVLFVVLRLDIRITPAALWFRFFPLHLRWREVPLATIAGARAVVYRPLFEYGGWGIRLGKKGWAYTISGNRGVQVTLKDGTSFLLGSQRERQIEAILHSLSAAGR